MRLREGRTYAVEELELNGFIMTPTPEYLSYTDPRRSSYYRINHNDLDFCYWAHMYMTSYGRRYRIVSRSEDGYRFDGR